MNVKNSIIYNGDAYDLIKLVPDKTVDLIYTDLPQNIKSHGTIGTGKNNHQYHKDCKQTCSDNEFGIDLSILDEFVRVLKKINIYIWCSKNQFMPLLDYFVGKHGCYFDILVWDKINPVPECNNKYLNDTEYCLFFRESGVKINGDYKTKFKYFISPVNIKDKRAYDYPVCKPVEFIKNHIINSTEENDLVIDCFMGSGSTGVACRDLNRKFIGIEIDKEYCRIAKDRIENYTTTNDSAQMTIDDILRGEV